MKRIDEFEQYLDFEIEKIEKSLERSLEADDSSLSKKNTAVLYQLRLVKRISEDMPLEDVYNFIKIMDETLDDEIDAYLDISDNAYEESHYLCLSTKKSSLKAMLDILNKMIEIIF